MPAKFATFLVIAGVQLLPGAAFADDPHFPRRAVGDPALEPPHAAPQVRGPAAHAARSADPTRDAVRRARETGLIDEAAGDRYLSILANARATFRRLGGRRRAELGYVLGAMRRIAGRGELYSHRLPAAFETIRRNREWWGSRGAPATGRRVRFPGSRVIWQYYPGHGMQLQALANFGRANAYWSHGDAENDRGLRELLDEMLALASQRAGGTAWEYWFDFGGGRPPWTSAISQGTAIQALVRGAARLGRPDYLAAAGSALGVFRANTPVGVRVPLGTDGAWYALYSFSPGLRVLNAHTQALNGLFDLASSPSAVANEARVIYDTGLRALLSRIGPFDTGAWSKYANPGAEAMLDYHRLNRDVLRNLCERSREPKVCGPAERFTRYLQQDPRVTRIAVGRARPGRLFAVRFFLDKASSVRLYVKAAGGGRVLSGARVGALRGSHRAVLRAPRRSGTYRLDVRATDRAGNSGSAGPVALRVRR